LKLPLKDKSKYQYEKKFPPFPPSKLINVKNYKLKFYLGRLFDKNWDISSTIFQSRFQNSHEKITFLHTFIRILMRFCELMVWYMLSNDNISNVLMCFFVLSYDFCFCIIEKIPLLYWKSFFFLNENRKTKISLLLYCSRENTFWTFQIPLEPRSQGFKMPKMLKTHSSNVKLN